MGTIGIALVLVIFGILLVGIWIGPALIMSGVVIAILFSDIPIGRLIPQYTFNIFTTPDLLALPLYILMGEILFHTRLSRSLFTGLAPWAGLLPGRLLHVNVLACSVFAAISGSSAATAQVVGRISLAELLRRGYRPSVAMGSLAGAGTLGFLIPPSTVMIVYGVLADQSIIRLFAAGLIPGILLAMCFMAWIMIHTTINPELIPESERALRKLPMRARISALRELAPVLFLILCVLGSMYGGIATPSEAAAIGVAGAFLIAAQQRMLSLSTLRDILIGATQTSSMMGIIILGATVLGNVNSFLGVPEYLANFVDSMNLSPFLLILALMALYLVLGSFLEGFAIIVTTLPVVFPLIIASGFDPIWFGIYLVLVVEMAQITPPLGFNLFIIRALTGESLSFLFRVTFPYLAIMVLFVLFIAIFPEIALWLPTALYK